MDGFVRAGTLITENLGPGIADGIEEVIEPRLVNLRQVPGWSARFPGPPVIASRSARAMPLKRRSYFRWY